MRIPFIGGAYRGRTGSADPSQFINYYVETDPHSTRTPKYAVPTPGTTLLTNLNGGPVRLNYLAVLSGTLTAFSVSGNTVYKKVINSPTSLGTIGTSTGPVQAVDNGRQVLFCDGATLHVYDSNNDPVIGGPYSITGGTAPIQTADEHWSVTFTSSGVSTSSLIPGSCIVVTGLTPTTLNQQWTITSTTSTTITVTSSKVSNPGTYSSGTGTATLQTFFQVKDQNVPGQGATAGSPGTITWQDGYALLNETGSGFFWWSAVNQFNIWPGLQFANAEAYRNNLVSVISDGSRIYLLSNFHTEVWVDTGSANAQFQLLPGAVYLKGCVASHSPQVIDSSVIWLGGTPGGQVQLFQMRGTNVPEVISTSQIEWQWAQYSTVTDAIGSQYLIQGHEFYILQFPTAGTTWVYDVRTQEWHQRSTGSGNWLMSGGVINDAGALYTGDASGNILSLTDAALTDYNNQTINRTIVGPYLIDQHERLFVTDVEIIGNFQEITNGSQLTLSYSKDNNNTFPSSFTYTTTASNLQRMIFRRLGWGRGWIFKLVTTANPTILDALCHLRNRTEGRPPDTPMQPALGEKF